MDRHSSPEEVSKFLEDELSIPSAFTEVFTEHYIDGAEFYNLTFQDIEKLIKPIGICKKIYRYIENHNKKTSFSGADEEAVVLSTSDPVSEFVTPVRSSSSLLTTPIPPADSTPILSSSPHTPTTSIKCHDFPSPFPIPDCWGEKVDAVLKEKRLTPFVRKEIVDTLCCSIKVYSSGRPTKLQCTSVATELVKKYPFLKDPIGSETGSWTHKFLEKFRNARKYRKRVHGIMESPEGSKAVKKQKCDSDSEVTTSSSESDLLAMEKELKHDRPRSDILCELMKSTFLARKKLVKDKKSVADIVKTYPALKIPSVLEHEMTLWTDIKIKDKYTRNWRLWVSAIIEYTKNVKKKDIIKLHSSVTTELDSNAQQELALKLLVCSLLPKGKDICESMKELFSEHDVSCSLEQLSVDPPPKNSPRIIKLTGGHKPQFFILVEQDVLTEVYSISQAIFFCGPVFTSFLICNMQLHLPMLASFLKTWCFYYQK